MIGRDIAHARTCGRVKTLNRRGNYLVTLAHKHDVKWSVNDARKAKTRIGRKACSKEARICHEVTKSCRR
jgi:hypothetical protein